nr:MAG TPA: hypothetical protein [Caudoviricetes sp.]
METVFVSKYHLRFSINVVNICCLHLLKFELKCEPEGSYHG